MSRPEQREHKNQNARMARLTLTEPPSLLATARTFVTGMGLPESYVRNLEDLRVWDYVGDFYPGGRAAFKRDYRKGLFDE
jgi:hypothetical protein